MGDSFTRFGINQLNHKLKVKKGGIEVTSGNISGSVTSTGSFGRVEAVSISGDGSAISSVSVAPWESTSSFYNAVSDIQITGSLKVLGNITGSYGGLAVGQKYLHEQSSAATTWTISHNFEYQYVNVDVYDGNDQIVIPTSVTATDGNTLTLTFSSPVSGNAIISTGGQAIDERGKNVVHNQSSAATNWRVTHSIGEQYPAVTVYDDTDSVIIPQQIKAFDGSKMEIIFAQPVSGNANISVGGGVPSGAITSSAQIATDISGSLGSNATLIRSLTAVGVSGSFTELSTSLASRIAAEEVEAEGTVVSSSAQIATDISGSLGTNATLIRSLTAVGVSGSFISVSSSLASRIAAEEAEAEGTVVSSSAQIASDISGSLGTNASLIRSLTATGVSGSFISVSSSLASRIAAEEAEAEGTVVSSSAQIATDISGSLGANASLIRSLTAAAISGSVVAGVSGSALSTGSFGKLEVGGSSTLSGDLTVGGRLTAQEFHTEFVSSSIMFQSGSTKFGDSAADTHTFTGKMEISGSQAKVSASVGATGSFGHLFLAKGAHITDRLYFSDVGGEYISGDGTDLNLVSGNDINVPTDIGLTFGNDGEKIEGNGTRMSIASGTGMVLDCEGDVEINADGGVIDFKDDSAYLLKVSSTKVSGSAASTGSFGRIEGSVFSGSFIGKGTFNNIDDPTAMAIALG
jgi:hypothetical protein